MPLVDVSRRLSARVSALSFAPPITHVYNPLDYARRPHEIYLKKYGAGGPGRLLLIGMNPGPFGMAQTAPTYGDGGFGECLNEHWFISLAEAQAQIEAWRVDDNIVRPHSAQDDRTRASAGASGAGSRRRRGCVRLPNGSPQPARDR